VEIYDSLEEEIEDLYTRHKGYMNK